MRIFIILSYLTFMVVISSFDDHIFISGVNACWRGSTTL